MEDWVMYTFYVIYDVFTMSFVRAGRGLYWTHSMNNAKHFTSRWSAESFIQHNWTDELSECLVKEIKRY